MKRKVYTIWIMLLVVMLMATPVYAGNIKLSGSWGSGSIHFDGYATGVGGYDGITLEVIGYGDPIITCTNQGGNDAPGQNPASITVYGITPMTSDDITASTKKGKTSVAVKADEDNLVISGTEGGCPNDNWTATIDSIEWTGATINVYDGYFPGGNYTADDLLKTFNYTCDPSKKVGDDLYCTLVSAITY